MVILGPPIDSDEVAGGEFHVDPVDDMQEYDLVGTTFHRGRSVDMFVTIRRWFLVNLEKLDSGGYDVSVDVHDQQFVNPIAPSSAGQPQNTNKQILEKTFGPPDFDPVFPWIEDDISFWLRDWNDENPPTELMP